MLPITPAYLTVAADARDPSILPTPLPLEPLQDIDTAYQNWYFYQRTYRAGESLLAVDAVDSHDHSNSELEVITGSRKTLRAADSVTEAELVAHEDDEGKGDGEINDQRRHYAQDVDDLVDDMLALGGEEYNDGEDEAGEGEG